MLRSFRLKIGILSTLISGILLLGLGFFSASVLNRVGLDRVDRELRALADAQVRKIQPPGHWRRFNDSLSAVYGEDVTRQFAVKASRPDGETIYASDPWPPEIPSSSLPLSLAGVKPFAAEGPAAEEVAPPPDDRGGRSPRPLDESPPRSPPPRRMPVRGPVYATLGGADGCWRAMTIANDDVTLSIGMSLAGLRAETQHFRRALLVGLPIGLLMIVAGGWLIGHMALRPVSAIARTAETVTASRLSERIPEGNADEEFKRLVALINGMLERLERSFQQATRFSADAAHELKTPLAILQAQLERSLQRAADGSAEQREYAEQLDEVQRLKVILGKLLLLSQADAGRLPLGREPVNLAELVRAGADDARMLAPDRKIGAESPQELPVTGDPHLLSQVIENLVTNAVKFGDREGNIDLALRSEGGAAVLTVSNTGRPIPAEDQDKIFDRFYRGDKARARDVDGAGLGLSLAREIARAHGGELILQRSEELATTFALTLPLASSGKPFDPATNTERSGKL
jgi:two-component system, OmpR family, heavy metal sensor histidine kinase CusS